MKIINYYPYRTAFVRGAEFPRELMKDLENKLRELNDGHIDNHVCFKVEDEHYNEIYIMFHDFVCIIGDSIEIRRW